MLNIDSPQTLEVWGPLTRFFHWSLALFFTLSYLSEDNFELIHFYTGYAITALIIFRIIWGVIGPKNSRFSHFVKKPSAAIGYLKSLLTTTPQHYLGHNPAGGLMVVALLCMLALSVTSGMTLLAIEGSGPLANSFVASFNEDFMEEVHELFANGTLLLVCLHIVGVIVSSLVHKENLARAMITGVKQKKTEHDEEYKQK